ncbi:hypothetical protein BKA93DRAFT_564068 [Sparassis latifolia]
MISPPSRPTYVRQLMLTSPKTRSPELPHSSLSFSESHVFCPRCSCPELAYMPYSTVKLVHPISIHLSMRVLHAVPGAMSRPMYRGSRSLSCSPVPYFDVLIDFIASQCFTFILCTLASVVFASLVPSDGTCNAHWLRILVCHQWRSVDMSTKRTTRPARLFNVLVLATIHEITVPI